ncbi:hypothetical protein KO506_06810 [Polaribacter vadi]|uniref:hypothetical protein n=1 Tax=Polaribacter TaxID=52959 RepID=UPI001C09F650|nr:MULTISPECIES: hypothetical protein [Polaribacter]MBU3011106.1 hypothetical protein [Polaribacter vadi]MDO6740920.1 hypothetical protein [Polaribacter sp. 1_MG-2023]
MKEVEIEVYDKREKVTTTLCVEQITEIQFRMIDNDLFNNQLTLGVEFETKINSKNKHEVVKILKKSEFITRRFSLQPNYKESDYRMLGDELTKRGGFWQVDLGSIATVNIPKSFEFDINQVIKDLELVEITD